MPNDHARQRLVAAFRAFESVGDVPSKRAVYDVARRMGAKFRDIEASPILDAFLDASGKRKTSTREASGTRPHAGANKELLVTKSVIAIANAQNAEITPPAGARDYTTIACSTKSDEVAPKRLEVVPIPPELVREVVPITEPTHSEPPREARKKPRVSERPLEISAELTAKLAEIGMMPWGVGDIPNAEARLWPVIRDGRYRAAENPAGFVRAAALGGWSTAWPTPGSEWAAASAQEPPRPVPPSPAKPAPRVESPTPAPEPRRIQTPEEIERQRTIYEDLKRGKFVKHLPGPGD